MKKIPGKIFSKAEKQKNIYKKDTLVIKPPFKNMRNFSGKNFLTKSTLKREIPQRLHSL